MLERIGGVMYAARRRLGLVRPVPDKLWSADARSYLRQAGCPVCHAILEWLPRNLFWFFEEQYHHPSTIAEMEDSLGLCRIHAAEFLEIAPPYRIGYTHLLMLYGTLRRLRRLQRAAQGARRARELRGGPRVERPIPTEGLDRRGLCLICRQERDTARSTSHILIYALRDAEILAEIESFGKFCAPHFRLAAEVAPGELLRLLVPVEVKGLLAAMAQAHALPSGGPLSGGEAAEPLGTACRIVARGVGADVNEQRRKAPTGTRPALEPGEPQWDPVPSPKRMLALLGEAKCPICTLTQEALASYLAWYKAGVAQWMGGPRRSGDGFGRLCREHTWMVARDLDSAVLLDVGRFMAEEDRAHLERVEAFLTEPAPPPPWRTKVPLRRLLRETRVWIGKMHRREERRLDHARWSIRESRECSACVHARRITDRSLALLFAVLQDAAARGRYRGAWGLCVQHFSHGLSLAMEPEVLETLLDVQIARLVTLDWELQEYYRKASWEIRFEPKGPEQTAWGRAIERFSGTDLRPAREPASA